MDVWLVHNPAAGPYDIGPCVLRVTEGLNAQGVPARAFTAERPGELGEIGRRAQREGCTEFFVAGGDGSLSEAATALMGSTTALGTIPAGTSNVWARQLGLPVPPLLPGFDPTELFLGVARAQLEGQRRRIDVGQVGDRCFVLWAGIGLDAFVTHAVEPRPRAQKRLGIVSYAAAAIMLAAQFKGTRAQVYVDGRRRVRGNILLAVVSNGQLYMGGLARIDPEARIDDGVLDVWVFYGLGLGWTVRQMVGLLTGRHLRDPHVRHFRGRAVSVTTRTPAELHLDGDPWGTTPVAVQVRPRALTVLVPASAPRNLFQD